MLLLFFLFLFLSHLFVKLTLKPQSSPLKPQPSLLFHANADADNHFHADLSLAMIFFFFGCGLMGGLGLDGDVWVQIVLAGFGSDRGGWVRMG